MSNVPEISEFNTLYKQQRPVLLHYAMGYLKDQEAAEDIVAEAFIKTWNRYEDFESKENTTAFLFVVTRNACLDYLKSAKRRIVYDQDVLEQLPHYTDIFLSMVNAELLSLVRSEIDKLPEKQREVLRLSFLEGLSTEEICSQLNISASAVFANRSLGLQKLRKSIQSEHLLLAISVLDLLNRF